MPLEITLLSERPAFIDACSAWTFGQWGVYSRRTLEETRLLFASAAHGSGLPLTRVAHDGDRPLGMASLFENDCAQRPDLRPWLAAVFVHPDHRGLGIAGRLIEAIEQDARARGETRLYLITTDRQALYEHHGWRRTGTVDYSDCPCILMAKTL